MDSMEHVQEDARKPFLSDEVHTSIDLERNNTDANQIIKNSPQGPHRANRVRHYFEILRVYVLGLGWILAVMLLFMPKEGPHYPLSPLPANVFGTVKRTFHFDDRYAGPSNEVNEHWANLIAAHDVLYVSKQDQRKHHLPMGITSSFLHPDRPDLSTQDFYVLSIMHSMHCLNNIRVHYWQLKNGGTSRLTNAGFHTDSHIDHCFDYLRQSILCGNAVYEVEGYDPVLTPSGEVSSKASGWGVEHNCVDYDAIAQYQINQEAAYNMTWQSNARRYFG